MEEIQQDASASESPAVDLEGGEAQVASPAAEQVESGGSVEPAIPQAFTVKVGGEEMQVSLEEALAGYQRQEDYTRKTQDIAAQREQLGHADRLWNALETNPQATVAELAKAYGLALGATQTPEEDPFAEPTSPTEKQDPRWQQVETFMQQAQMQSLQTQIERELLQIHQTYGVNFKDDDLLQFAVDRNITDLDAAFKAFAFDGLTKAASNRQAQRRKENAPPVASGHGANTSVVTPGTGSRLMSLADAFAAAEAAHGQA